MPKITIEFEDGDVEKFNLDSGFMVYTEGEQLRSAIIRCSYPGAAILILNTLGNFLLDGYPDDKIHTASFCRTN